MVKQQMFVLPASKGYPIFPCCCYHFCMQTMLPPHVWVGLLSGDDGICTRFIYIYSTFSFKSKIQIHLKWRVLLLVGHLFVIKKKKFVFWFAYYLCSLPPSKHQIMPQLLYFLKLDTVSSPSIDWGTLLIYTCSNSCSTKSGYEEEFLWKQDFSDFSRKQIK